MLVPVLLTLALAASYLVLAIRQHRSPRGWSLRRTVLFLTGCGLLILGFTQQALPFAEGDFRRHMVAHLLLAMLAPIGLVMAAPVTLLLRTLPSRSGRIVTATLRHPVLQAVANPAVALLVDMGGMAALYFTPLYTAMMTHPVLHYAVHLHFVAAGCLYTWVIAGPDPAPHRPSVPMRLLTLGAAIVLHSVLSQLLYSGWHVRVATTVLQRHQAAELMYYGGDITEMLLAFALVSTWHPRRSSPVQTLKHA